MTEAEAPGPRLKGLNSPRKRRKLAARERRARRARGRRMLVKLGIFVGLPTVIAAILIVGQPTPTGTDCPSLPQVQIPSDTSKSWPSIFTLRMASGPLPIRFTPLSGAVSFPSSIK